MKKMLAVLLLALIAPITAHAEDYLGTITLTAGASKNNRDTAAPFIINVQKATIQCTVDMWVCTDTSTCSATVGFYVAAQPSSLPTSITYRGDPTSSGSSSYIVSIFPVSGTTGACRVYGRKGDEITQLLKSYTYFGV
jgi:hypothetical protein